jgi:MFS family permease
VFGATFGLASVIGPLIGGFFTDLGPLHLGSAEVAGWRWIFYINLPLAGLALFMILSRMPKLTHRVGGRIDFIGAALLVVTFVPLLLALSWGGHDMAWGSPQILALFSLSAVGLLGFLYAEAKVENPIVALGLFKNRTFSSANAAGFLTFMAFMGLVAFLPLYLQLGQGVSATVSGLTMLPLTVGLIASATLSGLLVTRTGKYRWIMIAGSALVIAGALLLSRVGPESSTLDVAARVLLLGLGLGPAQSLFNLAIQNAVDPRQLGVATSSSQFFRQVGQTIGVAVFGTVLTHNLQVEAARAPRPPSAHVQTLTLTDLERMAVTAQNAGHASPGGAMAHAKPLAPEVRQTITAAIRGVILTGAIVAILALLAVLFVPELPLRSRPRSEPLGEAPGEPPPEPEPAST